MADIVKATRKFLQTVTAVTDLVSVRVMVDVLGQGETMPAVVLSKVSGVSHQSLFGPVGGGQTRIQADCYAEEAEDAEAIREQLRIAMQNHGSNRGAHTALGDEVATGIIVDGMFDRTEADPAGGQKWRYVRSIDFMIGYQEAIV